MQNLYSDTETKSIMDNDIDMCVYTSQLLGQDSQLILHGSDNTSVKTTHTTLLGEVIDVICISNCNLARINASALPTLQLKPLLRLRELNELSDEAMINFQRTQLIDSHSPNPSIETLLHAFLPHKFINHTHANAILSITNQANNIELIEKIYGNRMGIVPYIKPGFKLAKKVAETYDSNPKVEGLILLNHGIFTFGNTAKLAYNRMIEATTRAEEYIQKNSKQSHFTVPKIESPLRVEDIAPIIRGVCVHNKKRVIVTYRNNALIEKYINGEQLQQYSQHGVTTPDHIIWTKNKPLIVYTGKSLNDFNENLARALSDFKDDYNRYFVKHNSSQGHPRAKLDPIPRVILVPQIGLFAIGTSAANSNVVADIAENTMQTILDAEAIGKYTALTEDKLFEIEYNSLEQAKLLKNGEKPMARKVVVITDGAGTIGKATALAFAKRGAEIALLDTNLIACQKTATEIGGNTLALRCDLTDENDIATSFSIICKKFGGVDITILNSCKAYTGKIASIDNELLRNSFEINFFAHHAVAKQAVNIMLKQKTGGSLLFNVSKQPLNPSLEFGPYSIPKAATLALVRQYAIDYAAFGVHASAVNADRIRSSLLDEEIVKKRAKARGVTVTEYMENNSFQQAASANDIAQAFVHQALAQKTTTGISTVDYSNSVFETR